MTALALTAEHLDELRKAKRLLESPGFAARMANLLGSPIEMLLNYMPSQAKDVITTSVEKALSTSLQWAVYTMEDKTQPATSWGHTLSVMTSGFVGGAFGLAALPIELPFSTTVIMRSIADIARSEGEQITSGEAKLACLEVFALGGPAKRDNGTDSGYFAVRSVLAKAVSEAASYLAGEALAEKSAPQLVKLVAQIGTRYGVQVSEKMAAQAVPIVGAVGGAVINTAFIDHFQNMARGHFVVRRLERTYGSETVKSAYDSLPIE